MQKSKLEKYETENVKLLKNYGLMNPDAVKPRPFYDLRQMLEGPAQYYFKQIDEIDLIERDVLQVTYEDEIGAEGIGRIGRLREEMSLIELCDFVKERFMLDTVKVFGDPDRLCNICAISPGSGKSMIKYAIEKGADVIITGDIDHHEGIDSVAQGLWVIDAGHFGIEKIFVPYMEEFIRREMPEIKVYTHEMTSPFMVL